MRPWSEVTRQAFWGLGMAMDGTCWVTIHLLKEGQHLAM